MEHYMCTVFMILPSEPRQFGRSTRKKDNSFISISEAFILS